MKILNTIIVLFLFSICNAQNIPTDSKKFNNLKIYLVSEGKDKRIKMEEKQSFESNSEISVFASDDGYGLMLKSNYLTDGNRTFFYITASKKIGSENGLDCYSLYTEDSIIKPTFNACYSNDTNLVVVQYFLKELMFTFK
ncbi:hypothetical protein HX088_11255 [Empedobacter sp. 225-1]|uniref:hypothetical protein n=1 Tax=Empedobacter sp. 225-1 TaxID=2746725 RepID=UPI002575F916|nr:hypothetical protein [Empedobacter sp. 225-1]MDM1523843.1 hypothetical protein [Empedobacter sp. 225-1]